MSSDEEDSKQQSENELEELLSDYDEIKFNRKKRSREEATRDDEENESENQQTFKKINTTVMVAPDINNNNNVNNNALVVSAAAATTNNNNTTNNNTPWSEQDCLQEIDDNTVRSMSVDRLLERLEYLERFYSWSTTDYHDIMNRAERILRFNINDISHDATFLENQIRKAAREMTCLTFVSTQLRATQTANERRLVNVDRRINALCRKLWHLSQMMSSMLQARMFPLTVSEGHALVGLMRFTSAINKAESELAAEQGAKGKPNLFDPLLERLLDYAMKEGFRKGTDGYCYRELVLKNGVGTRAWAQDKSIEDYVWQSYKQYEQDSEMHKLYKHSTSLIKQAIEWLTKTDDVRFPFVKRSRYVHSFRDGIYVVNQNRFWFHGDLTMPQHLVACKFHDVEFGSLFAKELATEELREQMFIDDDERHTWREIQTKWFDTILDTQGFSIEVKDIIYTMCGRMLYNSHELDSWQVMMFFKGLAGTGKSTVLKVVQQFFDSCDVFIMSNNLEEKFGLQGIDQSYIVLAPDVKRDFSLDQATWQSIVSGESFSYAVKNLPAKQMQKGLKSPMMAAGNEVFNWIDNAASVARRMIVAQFDVTVKEVDTSLDAKLSNEMAHIMFKCNRAYRSKVRLWGNKGIHANLPKYFIKTARSLQSDCQPLLAFIDSDHVKVRQKNDPLMGADDDDFYVSVEDFTTRLKRWCVLNGRKIPVWKPDLYSGIFQNNDVHIERKSMIYPRGSGISTEMDFIFGLKLTELHPRAMGATSNNNFSNHNATATHGGAIASNRRRN